MSTTERNGGPLDGMSRTQQHLEHLLKTEKKKKKTICLCCFILPHVNQSDETNTGVCHWLLIVNLVPLSLIMCRGGPTRETVLLLLSAHAIPRTPHVVTACRHRCCVWVYSCLYATGSRRGRYLLRRALHKPKWFSAKGKCSTKEAVSRTYYYPPWESVISVNAIHLKEMNLCIVYLRYRCFLQSTTSTTSTEKNGQKDGKCLFDEV